MDFSKQLVKFLNKFLDPYVENLSAQNFEKRIFALSPTIVFENLKIKREVLTLLGYEGLVVTDGEIQRLEFRIPWKVLFTGKIKVIVEGVCLEVEQDKRGTMVDMMEKQKVEELRATLRKEKEDAIQAQMKYLKALKKAQNDGANATDKLSTGAKIAQRVISNVDVEVTRTKLAFKSNFRGMWCCLKCEEFAVYSTDKDFKRTDQVYPDGLIRKLMGIRDLSLELATATEPGGKIDEQKTDHVVQPLSVILQLKQEKEGPDNQRLLSVSILVSTEVWSHIQLQRSDVKHLMQLQVDYSTERQQLREILVPLEQDEYILCNFDECVKEYRDHYWQKMETEAESPSGELFDPIKASSEDPLQPLESMQLLEDALPVRVIARQRFQLKEAWKQGKLGSFATSTFSYSETKMTSSSRSKDSSDDFQEEFLAELENFGPMEYPDNMSFTIELGKSSLAVVDDRFEDEHRDILSLTRDSTTVHVDYSTHGDDITVEVCVRLGGVEVTHAKQTWISIQQPKIDCPDSTYKEAAFVQFKALMDFDDMELSLKGSLAPIELSCANEALGSVIEVFTLPVEPVKRRETIYEQEEHRERLQELREKPLFQAAAAAGAEAMPDPSMSMKRTLFLEIDIASPVINVPVRDSGNVTMSLGKLRLCTPQKCGFSSIKLSVDLANTALHTRSNGRTFEIAPPMRRSIARTRVAGAIEDGEEGIHVDIDCQLQDQETAVNVDMSCPGWTFKLVPQVAQILLAVPESLTAMLANREVSAPETAAETCRQPYSTGSSKVEPSAGTVSNAPAGSWRSEQSAGSSRVEPSAGRPIAARPYTLPSGIMTESNTSEIPHGPSTLLRQLVSAAAATSAGAEKVSAFESQIEEVVKSKTTVKFAMTLDDEQSLMVTIANPVSVPILKLLVELPSPGVQVIFESGEPGALHVDVESSSLECQILNSRIGEWEPLIEPTKIAIKLDQGEVEERAETQRKMHLSLIGNEPLLLNVTPTAINTLCFIAPLYQRYFVNSEPHSPGTTKAGDCRILNLCEQEFEFAFSFTSSMTFTRQRETQFVKPGCELLLPLWTDDMSYTTVTMQVRLAHQEPPALFSESSSMGRTGATLVPGSPYIAQMSPTLDLHPTLLITSSMCVHNQSALPVNVKFCASPGESDIAVHLSAIVCDAAAMGHKQVYSLHPYTSIADQVVQAPEPRREVILLKPNELCSVPVTGIDFSDTSLPCTWMSVQPCGLTREFSKFEMFNAQSKARLLQCNSAVSDDIQEFCPAGHQLKQQLMRTNYRCDRCHREFSSGTALYGCRECNYDVCFNCLTKRALESVAADPSDKASFYFRCELDTPAESQGATGQKPFTIAVRPPLVLTHSLPLGCLIVKYVTKSSKVGRRVDLQKFDRLSLHDLEGPTGDEDMRMKINLSVKSGSDESATEDLKFSKEAVVRAADFQSSDLAPKQFEFIDEANCINYELIGTHEVKFCCAGLFIERTGLKPPFSVKLNLNGSKLPTLENVMLLPEGYHQASAQLLMCNDGKPLGAPLSVEMPVVGWSAVPWRTRLGDYDFCFQVQNYTLEDVHRTSCSVIEMRPRVVLSNLSDWDIDVRHSKAIDLQDHASDCINFCVQHGQHKDIHCYPEDENSIYFRPRRSTYECEWSFDEGLMMSDEADPGCFPFAVPVHRGNLQIWSIDRAPLYGALSLSFRQGSDFIAAHWAKTSKPMIVRTGNKHMTEYEFNVSTGQEVPYGWANPFLDSAVRIFIDGKPVLTVENVRCEGTHELKDLPCVVKVLQRGKQMLLALDDVDEDGPEAEKEQTASLFQLDVRLRHVGVSIVQEAPMPQEIFYVGFNSVRFQMRTGGGRDDEQYKFGISSAKIDCQLPAYIDDLEHKRFQFQRIDEKTSVIFTNIAEGELPLLAISIDKRANSHDILLHHLDLSMDTLELTVETAWVQPFLEWMKAIDTSSLPMPESGEELSQKIRLAGKCVTEGFVPLEVPSVMQIDNVKVSSISFLVWCNIDVTQMPFIPGWLRGSLRLLSAGNKKFILNGVSLRFDEYELPPVRGSFADILMKYCREHVMQILQVAVRAFTKSNVASTQIVDVSRQTASSGLQDVGATFNEFAFQLRGITALASGSKPESLERKKRQREKKIKNFAEGAAEAGVSLTKGAGHLFDFVRKPFKGAAEEGVKGFLKGTVSGVVGTVVKPIAGVLQAVGDLSSGSAAAFTVNTEEKERHRRHERQRLPRVMFGEFGALRSWSLLEALTLEQMGGIEPDGYSRLKGVAEVMPLVQVDRSCTVLLLFASHLEMAFVDLPEVAIGEGKTGPPVRVTDQDSWEEFHKAESLRPSRRPGLNVTCNFANEDASTTIAELALSGPCKSQDVNCMRYELMITNKEGIHLFEHEAFKCPKDSLSSMSLQDRSTWYALQAAMRSERTRLRKKLRQSSEESINETIKKARVFEIERWNGFEADWETPWWKGDEKHLGWRWVDERGFRHPHLRRHMSQEECSESETPPCDYKGLLTAVDGEEWKVDKDMETEWSKTDADGWVYATRVNSPVWEPKCTMTHLVRKRQWSRLFC